jgi:nicotinate-nucleotide--dimethylbenzimidazole phosphoribosyltransferase
MIEKINAAIEAVHPLDIQLLAKAQERLDSLTKPQGSLGRLEEIAKKVVGITGTLTPSLARKVIITVAADHGVADENVSAYPKEVTAQMVLNFLQGGAAINVLARHIGARVIIVDAGVAVDMPSHPALMVKKIAHGTCNFTKGPAMTRRQAEESIVTGIALVEEQRVLGMDMVGTGDMGIANTTSSSAVIAAITGEDPSKVTGKGTGIDDVRLAHKVAVIKKALSINNFNSTDGIDVLQKLGGFEIGVLAGVFIGAAANRIPAVIDGVISGAAALIAATIEPKVKLYMLASHNSVEMGHRAALEYMGIEQLFDFGMRLGEGTGAAIGMNMIDASVKLLNEMATFSSAGVSSKK